MKRLRKIVILTLIAIVAGSGPAAAHAGEYCIDNGPVRVLGTEVFPAGETCVPGP